MAKRKPVKRQLQGEGAFEIWKRVAISRGGIAAFLARPEKGWTPGSGDPPVTNMVLKTEGVKHGVFRMTLCDEGGMPRIIFFVPKFELAQVCAEALREEKGADE